MKGFSLFELLIVLSLVTIITVFAIPSMQQHYLSYKTTTDVNQIVRILNYARTQAILTSQSIQLCPKVNQSAQCGQDWSNGINVIEINHGQSELIQQTEKLKDAVLTWNRNSNQVTFNQYGFLQSQNGSFTYELDSKKNFTKKIILSSTGRIRIE